ncbi:hypothetical protein HD554DRAFT_2098163 [Boletus coccyginus]|nr:hypothetical protein HD554DRAFT_2098163 [Boletus coccyginus]
MATFDYVEIPADAIRLKPASLEPATKIPTSLPDTTPSSSRPAFEPLSPAKSALALVPQMLLSASPPLPSATSAIATPHSLLSSRDPLSVQIMSANFRRFVSRVGPVFWLQDRGWKRTTVWLAAYGFFCHFPRMALLIPHVVLLGVMLCYYPDPGAQPVPINVGEGTADWQANIQAIQNLMGAFSDAHDTIVPLLPLLVAPSLSTSIPTPSHEPTPKLPRRTSEPPCTPVNETPSQPHHPFLIITLVTFLLFIPILMIDLLPLRLLFFLAGAGTVCALHPRFRGSLSIVSTALVRLADAVWNAPLAHVELWENERWVQDAADVKQRKSVVTFAREGEEEGGEDDAASTTSNATATSSTMTGLAGAGKGTATGGTWSKVNLKPNERVGWTRGRDGWSGVGGEVSNLTFSLSPGWAFVETEGWRPDLIASWAVESAGPSASVCVGADEDGWTYTTDTWIHPRPDARPCDGWVTRRRRWTRRVYSKGVER